MLSLRQALVMLPLIVLAAPGIVHAQEAAIRAAVADPARPAAPSGLRPEGPPGGAPGWPG